MTGQRCTSILVMKLWGMWVRGMLGWALGGKNILYVCVLARNLLLFVFHSQASQDNISQHIYTWWIDDSHWETTQTKVRNVQLSTESFGDCITEPSQTKYLPCHPEILLVSSWHVSFLSNQRRAPFWLNFSGQNILHSPRSFLPFIHMRCRCHVALLSLPVSVPFYSCEVWWGLISLPGFDTTCWVCTRDRSFLISLPARLRHISMQCP